jgi:hypothetical protein
MCEIPERHVVEQTFYSQLDNDIDSDSGPWNECSFSALAGSLSVHGLVGDGNGQFDDQIERAFESMGLTRGSPKDMEYFVNQTYGGMGIRDDFRFDGNLAEIKKALLDGCGVVLHTDLTPSGHVIAVAGYDDNAYRGAGALIVNDPNGEWFPDGYDQGVTGEHVYCSYALCDRLMGPDNNYWVHVIRKG